MNSILLKLKIGLSNFLFGETTSNPNNPYKDYDGGPGGRFRRDGTLKHKYKSREGMIQEIVDCKKKELPDFYMESIIKEWEEENEEKLYAPIQKEETWKDFEESVRVEFKKYSDSSNLTVSGADGGIDVIVEIDSLIIGVQVKHYQSSVGNKAIGEVLMGMGRYECDYGCVVAKNGYTSSAHNSARASNIKLLSIGDIESYINNIKKGG